MKERYQNMRKVLFNANIEDEKRVAQRRESQKAKRELKRSNSQEMGPKVEVKVPKKRS
jgi:hypothetical protein